MNQRERTVFRKYLERRGLKLTAERQAVFDELFARHEHFEADERTGEDIIYQQLGYLMRSGSPDSLDLMVATNYAVMAADLALEGATGRLVALRSGTYTAVPISATREGVRRVDVDELYDVAQYRPKVRHVAGKPMFLY